MLMVNPATKAAIGLVQLRFESTLHSSAEMTADDKIKIVAKTANGSRTNRRIMKSGLPAAGADPLFIAINQYASDARVKPTAVPCTKRHGYTQQMLLRSKLDVWLGNSCRLQWELNGFG